MNIRSHAAAKMDRDVYHALDYLTLRVAAARPRCARRGKWVEFVESNRDAERADAPDRLCGGAIPARYALERGEWAEAAQLSLRPASPTFDWTPFPEGEAVNAYARGLGAARSGNAAAAKAEVARLGKLREAMVTQKKDYWIEQADIQVDTIRAWIARAEGRNDEALKLMRAAADREDKTEEHIMMPGRVIPVREMLGELLLDLKRPIAALAAFEESQRGDPNALPQRLRRRHVPPSWPASATRPGRTTRSCSSRSARTRRVVPRSNTRRRTSRSSEGRLPQFITIRHGRCAFAPHDRATDCEQTGGIDAWRGVWSHRHCCPGHIGRLPAEAGIVGGDASRRRRLPDRARRTRRATRLPTSTPFPSSWTRRRCRNGCVRSRQPARPTRRRAARSSNPPCGGASACCRARVFACAWRPAVSRV